MTKALSSMDFRPFSPASVIRFGNDFVPYLNDDHPKAAYDGDPTQIKFVAQPLHGAETNKANGVVTIPLMMTDEWKIVSQDHKIVSRLRRVKKKYDYMFVGQTGYTGREVFRDLKLVGLYYFHETKPIYGLDPDAKAEELKKFLFTLAEARFAFAPRGIGSSSFRAYQAMMVGTVPIITGMNDYPFESEANWDAMSIRGHIRDIHTRRQDKGAGAAVVPPRGLIDDSYDLSEDEYKNMRGRGMSFWDNFCAHHNLYGHLQKVRRSHAMAQPSNNDWGLGAD